MANEKTYPNYLMHYRTKGSKNGVSRTKGYTAVGQRAKGQYINGRYVYDNLLGKSFPATETGKRQSWQQIGNNYRAADEAVQRAATGQSRAVDISGNGRPQREEATNRYIAAVNKKSKQALQNIKKERSAAEIKGYANNWQQQGNNFRAANEAWERFGSGKSKNITGTDRKSNYGGYGTHASLEGSTRAMNAIADLGKLRREKKNLSLYGSGDTKTRNSRSDIANAFADAKADAKNAFKTMKKKAALSIFNKFSTGIRKDKKKKKSLKDLFK